MTTTNKKPQETEILQDAIIIHSTVQETPAPQKTIKICWNTGEEKNCAACYLSKGCKAKT
jgi:hypothetical protein